MGDTISTTQVSKNLNIEQYMQKLHYIQNIDDSHFGPVEIYRLKQPPYQYIMDYQKTYIEGNNSYIKYMKLMQQLSKTEHKNLAKIHLTQLKQETHVCIKDKKIHTFCNYYNFTLSQAIKKKKQQQAIFTESQLIYIMSCLADLAEYLKKLNISIGQYRTQSIYLSPQGYIKIYLFEIEQDNKHTCYYKAMVQRELIDTYILAPQQLKDMQNMEYDIKYDIFSADLFAIAFVIFELITQDDIKFYYNQTKTNYKFDRIEFDIDAVSKIYSEDFINLLKFCLRQDPRRRCTLQQATNQLNRLKKNNSNCTYCIRLHDDEGKKRTQAKKDSLLSSPKAPLGLTKLTPSPITTLSSSYSSSFKGNQTRNSSDISNDFGGKRSIKSPTFTQKTSENSSISKFSEKPSQNQVIYAQKGYYM